MWEGMFRFVSFHPEIAILGAITLIQIAPIKIDPWSALMRAIKRLLVGDIEKKLDSIASKVDTLEDQFSEEKALRARTHILRFADELYNGRRHEKEYFDDILDAINLYDKYCEEHPKFKNNRTAISAGLIKDTYEKMFKEHQSSKGESA